MKKIRVMTVFGTRPEAIKMAPLVKELSKCPHIESLVCVTAQHRQMLDQVLNIFEIVPHYDLNIMKDRQTLVGITTKSIDGLSEVYEKAQPHIVLVHGDTTTTFAGSLAAFYKQIQVGHVEAGLRTFDKYFPYPEEMNRKLTGCLTDIHFAPTKTNKDNLLRESVCKDSIFITGNTVIDALKTTIKNNYTFQTDKLNSINFSERKVLTVTAHRRENLGEPLENICLALKHIADNNQNTEIVYPVHLNPAVLEVANKILSNHSRIHLIDPLDVEDMHNLMSRSYIILTDSGGLQEEAPSLGKPVLVLRNETERPEAVEAGTVKVAGTRKDNIIMHAESLLNNESEYNKMAKAVNPYGDGNASKRIVSALLYHFKVINERPEEFISLL
jgi:UDP-N-acetylglucosamine 2-epimerase (non-hydrolysing)